MSKPTVHIIGSGISGLRCAEVLLDSGLDVKIYEKSERIGGRMKTDIVDGFLLDRGFHVMQTGYPHSISRISRSGSFNSALARLIRALCPPESITPLSPEPFYQIYYRILLMIFFAFLPWQLIYYSQMKEYLLHPIKQSSVPLNQAISFQILMKLNFLLCLTF